MSADIAALEQHHGKQFPVKGHAEIARPVGRKADPVDYPWGDFRAARTAARAEAWTLEQV